MGKSAVVLAVLASVAGCAQAQSAVTLYGTIDVGVAKKSDSNLTIGRRDNNRLGFKGTEALGDGLKALFQLEMRYDPDVGAIEGVTRPLFQGQSRVGLQGDFGMLRIGRGLTAYQESNAAFEPFRGTPSTAGFETDLMVAGYTSQPLDPAGSSANRFANAVFYNSPEAGGFQLNLTLGSKEANGNAKLDGTGSPTAPQYPANSPASSNPFSSSATYKAGALGAMLAYERNAAETKLWSIAGSAMLNAGLKLVASYQRQDQSHTLLVSPVTKAWVVGLNYDIGPGTLLAGYGQKQRDGSPTTMQLGLGYEYNLSKRTYLYFDASNKKSATAVDFYGLGIHHNF